MAVSSLTGADQVPKEDAADKAAPVCAILPLVTPMVSALPVACNKEQFDHLVGAIYKALLAESAGRFPCPEKANQPHVEKALHQKAPPRKKGEGELARRAKRTAIRREKRLAAAHAANINTHQNGRIVAAEAAKTEAAAAQAAAAEAAAAKAAAEQEAATAQVAAAEAVAAKAAAEQKTADKAAAMKTTAAQKSTPLKTPVSSQRAARDEKQVLNQIPPAPTADDKQPPVVALRSGLRSGLSPGSPPFKSQASPPPSHREVGMSGTTANPSTKSTRKRPASEAVSPPAPKADPLLRKEVCLSRTGQAFAVIGKSLAQAPETLYLLSPLLKPGWPNMCVIAQDHEFVVTDPKCPNLEQPEATWCNHQRFEGFLSGYLSACIDYRLDDEKAGKKLFNKLIREDGTKLQTLQRMCQK